MKNFGRILFLCLVVTSAKSQVPDFQFAKSFAQGRSVPSDMSIDKQGNIYLTGTFTGVLDLDPGPGVYTITSAGWEDIYIAKLDPGGNLHWGASFGANCNDVSNSITTDALGNVYVSGGFCEIVDFDPGPGTYTLSSPIDRDIFLLKLNSQGSFVWVKSFVEDGYGFATSLLIDSASNVFLGGTFANTIDLDPGPNVFSVTSDNNSPQSFILKLDATGNFSWATTFGQNPQNFGPSMTIDGKGNLYVTGGFNGTADFDPGTASYTLNSVSNKQDIYIAGYSGSGSLLWVKSVGGRDHDWPNAITLDGAGNILVTGVFQDTADFDTGSGVDLKISNGQTDNFILKLSPTGNFIWARTFGEASSELSNSIICDSSGNIYTTGRFSNTVDFDPDSGIENLAAFGSWDSYILKLNDSGNYVWAAQVGSSYAPVGPPGPSCIESGEAIALDQYNNIFVAGVFEDIADFDPSASTFTLQGYCTTYLMKLGDKTPLGFGRQFNENKFTVFPNPCSSHLSITLPEKSVTCVINIYNCQGQLIATREISENANTIDMSALSKGSYIITTKVGNNIYREKLIKI